MLAARIGINQQGDVLIAKVPEVQAASEYQRLSRGSNLISPSIQVKQVAQAALKENLLCLKFV